MLWLYVDDTWQESAGIFVLGGLIIDSSDYGTLQANIAAVKTAHGLRPDDPIKWSPPRQKEYKPQRDIADQNQFKKDILGAITASPVSVVVTIMEHSGRLLEPARANCFDRGIEFLAQRLQKEAASTNKRGRMVVEIPSTKIEAALLKRYKFIRVNGSIYPNFRMQLGSLDETLYYSHDFACIGIQAADFLVGSVGHCIGNRRYDYCRIVKTRFRNQSGRMKGFGVVLYPSNSLVADGLIQSCENP